MLTDQFTSVFFSVSFTHHVELLTKTKTLEERQFFIGKIVTEFWSVTTLQHHLKIKLFRKKGTMSNNFSTAITILIAFHGGQFRNFKHFYMGYVCVHLRDCFPNVVSYNRFIELSHRSAIPFMMFLHSCCRGECTGISFIDSTVLRVCHNKRIKRNKVFKGMAKVGKSTVGWFFGFKLHLIINDKGEILSFYLSQGNTHDSSANIAQINQQKLIAA